jgi:DNA-binding beta-propeller fold protein YncE
MHRLWRGLMAAVACGAFVSLGAASHPAADQNTARAQAPPLQAPAGSGPAYQVEVLWPMPLPKHWILGSITGVAVDAKDHVWLVHRGADSLNARTEIGLVGNPPGSEACCAPAPFVLEFDPSGRLLANWGGPGEGYEWPQSPGGITVDAKGNVWIAASGPPDPLPAARSTSEEPTGRAGGAAEAGRGGGRGGQGGGGRGGGGAAPPAPRPIDAHVLKFSGDGKFLLQIGHAGQTGGSDSKTALNRPTAVAVDTTTNEVFVADGLTNHRIVVFDSETGAYKRHWGAYGKPPEDAPPTPYDPSAQPSKQFNAVSCVEISKDGLVYVCDRKNNRIQVFRKDGTLTKEGFVSKGTLGEGSVWDVAFSNDARQRYLFVADGQDQKVWVLDRTTLEAVGSVGDGGRWPGHFYGVGSVAVDSKGNLYTGENFEGKRLQKFTPAARGGRR